MARVTSACILASAYMMLAATCGVQAQTGTAPPPSQRLSIADPSAYQLQSASLIQNRFGLYQSLSIGMLRVAWGWRALERSEGHWSFPENLQYLHLAQRDGFVFKMDLDDINAPPQWFLDEHPEARIVASNGAYDNSDLSLWYPGLRPVLQSKMDMTVKLLVQSGLVPSIKYLVIGLGPAGEPRYPAPWLPGTAHTDANLTFWYFDQNAQAAFVAKMQTKYPTLAQANAAWQTGFASWAAVTLPASNAATRMWADVVPWYLQTKRDFMQWQVTSILQSLHKYMQGSGTPQIMILLPGADVSSADLATASAGGKANFAMMIGADMAFTLYLAHMEGFWIQETGGQSQLAITYVKKLMAALGYDIPMWVENAGGSPALDPLHLASVVEQFGLRGLEYIDASVILQPDGITPTKTMPSFVQAYRNLTNYFQSHP